MDVHAAAPSLLISTNMDVHAAAHPSLLISIKMASETFKIWLIYITIPLYSFFTYNGYFIIIIQFIAYICRVECNNLSMHTTDDYISSIEQFQNMFII